MNHTLCGPERPDALIAAIAARQHGTFHRRQAIGAGFTPRMIEWRLNTGRWERVHEAVYRLAGTAGGWHQDLMAACLVLGGGCAASHRTAAVLWSLDGVPPGAREITVPGCGTRLSGVKVHRSRSLHRSAITTVEGLPVTKPGRTIIDLAAVLEVARLEEALDSALRQGLVSVGYLRRGLGTLGSNGRTGTHGLWALLDARADRRGSESPRELSLVRSLRAAGLPEPTAQFELRDEEGRLVARFDWAYADVCIGLEYNSYRHHYGRRAWEQDQTRYNRAAAYGWLVFVFTGADLHDPGRATIEAVRRAYEARRGDQLF